MDAKEKIDMLIFKAEIFVTKQFTTNSAITKFYVYSRLIKVPPFFNKIESVLLYVEAC